MAQMVVTFITGEERIQMLYRVVDVFLCGNTLVVAVLQCFIVFLRTVFRRLSSREHRMRRQEVERIRCIGLFAAVLVLYDGHIRLNTLNDMVHCTSPLLFPMMESKSISLQLSKRPALRRVANCCRENHVPESLSGSKQWRLSVCVSIR